MGFGVRLKRLCPLSNTSAEPIRICIYLTARSDHSDSVPSYLTSCLHWFRTNVSTFLDTLRLSVTSSQYSHFPIRVSKLFSRLSAPTSLVRRVVSFGPQSSCVSYASVIYLVAWHLTETQFLLSRLLMNNHHFHAEGYIWRYISTNYIDWTSMKQLCRCDVALFGKPIDCAKRFYEGSNVQHTQDDATCLQPCSMERV